MRVFVLLGVLGGEEGCGEPGREVDNRIVVVVVVMVDGMPN
jgi:hypothetical protein